MSQAPHRATATDEHAGRPCPYCRFAIKASVDIITCGECGAVHHADCWDDNAGCSIMGCAAAPGEGATTTQTNAVPTPPPPPRGVSVTTASVPAVPPPPPPPPTGAVPATKRAGGGVLIAAILALALAISGVAVALVVTNRDEPVTVASDTGDGGAAANGEFEDVSSPAPEAPTETATPEPVTTPEPTPEEVDTPEPDPEPESALPSATRGEMKSDIEEMLRTWHEDIVNGDPQAAWDMLTARKQSQNTRKYGFNEWARGQATLAPHLDPSGLRVSIQDVDDRTGVARVMVRGMGWSGPRCSEWSGITWVRWEDGMWRYDPGYSTTPQRERDWKHRVPELLGGRC